MLYIDRFRHLVIDDTNFDSRVLFKYLSIDPEQYISGDLPYYQLTPIQCTEAMMFGAKFVDELFLVSLLNTSDTPRNSMESLNSYNK